MSKFDQFDPIFFTPPSGKTSGPRRLFKGGGGGVSNPDTRYANLDALYGTQNQASQFMLDNAMPHIPVLTGNSAGMVRQAMDGTLSNQLAEQAGNNAAASAGAALDANNRNMQRYGMGMSANRMLSEGNRNAIMGAGMKAGEMNKARVAAEDMKWNRNASMFGQVMGMNNGAMQGMSSAGAGMSNIANQQSANDRANAAGYGQAGAAFSNALFKADGGFISGGKSRGFGLRLNSAKLANGGNAWEAYKAANPVKPMISGSSGRSGGTNPYMAMLSGAAPGMLGAGLRDVMKGDKSSMLKAGKGAYTWLSGKFNPSGNISMQGAPDYANAQLQPVDMTGFQPGADIATGAGTEAGTSAATELGASAASAAATEAGVQVGSDVLAQSTMEALGSAAVQEGSQQAAMLAAQDAAFLVADGGYIPDRKKGRGLRLAMGGMPTMQKMSVADNSGVSGLDSNQSLSLAKMDDPVKPNNAKPTGNAPGYWGNTDGMGETSYGDKDGFGKEHGDYRGIVGKGVLTYFGAGFASPLVHQIAEPLTRGMINAGDKAGGVTGAIITDPVGASASGKYSPDQIAAGNVAINLGVPWAGDAIHKASPKLYEKFFSEGGDVEPQRRADYTPGGDVRGPGTETSDDIPAWLSAGEIVENAEAVKLAGKDALLAINQAGRDVREGNASPQEARHEIGQVMIERGKQLAGGSIEAGIKQVARRAGERRGIGLKRGGCVPKLAGGGLLGGNLGIAMGAGVDQWNKQQQLDMAARASERADNADARAATEHEWKINDRKTQDGLRAELAGIENRAQLGDTDAYMAGKQDEAKAAAALSGIEYQPLTEEQRKVIASAPGLGKMTPTLRYEMDMQRAAAYRKAGDAKTGEAYAEKATQRASGDAIQALLAKDARTFGKLYHVFPNGDTPDSTEFDAEGNVVFDRGGQKETVKRKDAILSALALHDPKTAASMFQNGELVQERLDNWMKAQGATTRLREQQMNARNDALMAKIAAGGSGRSSSSGKSSVGAESSGIGLKDSDRMTIYDKSIPDDGFGGKISKADAIAQSSGRLNGMKALNPSLDDHQLIDASLEATKYHNGIPTRGTVNLVSDGRGGFYPAMTIQEVTGDRTIRLGQSIPYEQLNGKAEAFKSRGIVMPSSDQIGRARIEWINESAAEAEKVAKMFAEMTPQQINNLPPEQRKRMQNAGAEAEKLRNILQSESYGETESRRNLSRAPAPASAGLSSTAQQPGKASRVGNLAAATGHHAGKVLGRVSEPVREAGSAIKQGVSDAGEFLFSPTQERWRPQ